MTAARAHKRLFSDALESVRRETVRKLGRLDEAIEFSETFRPTPANSVPSTKRKAQRRR